MLTVRDGGNIELEVLGFFEGHNPFDENLNIGRIVGLVERDGYVTLEGCFYKNSTISSGGISKAHVFVHRALFGIAYDANEPVLLNEFRFSVEGLNAWLGLTGIQNIPLSVREPVTITYVPQEEITLDLRDGYRLVFGLSWSLPGSPTNNEAKITEKAFMRLVASEPKPFEEFSKIVRYLTNFLCFATDETVTIDTASGRVTDPSEEEGGDPQYLDMKIVYPSIPFSERTANPEWHQMLFRFPQIKDDAQTIVNNWLNAYEIFQPALDLYFSARAGAHRYLDSRFLALAQAAETLHRRTSDETFLEQAAYDVLVSQIISLCPQEHKEWLSSKLAYGNEISLARRLRRIIEPFKDRLRIPRDPGHRFHGMPVTDSTRSRSLIP